LHSRNKHRSRYDFEQLIASNQELGKFVKPNKYGDLSINFFDPHAVKALNRSLLMHFYKLDYWDIPQDYLCPPVPGRADYIHHIADLLFKKEPNNNIHCLDIGIGANCIYPIIGIEEYAWHFVGTDIDPLAIESCKKIKAMNKNISDHLELRVQQHQGAILQGIVKPADRFDIVICNPPFHASAKEARAAARKKLNNLKGKNVKQVRLNFAGQENELSYPGGEWQFIKTMIKESESFASQALWFSSLVSKKENLQQVIHFLKDQDVQDVQTIKMHQGNKSSRILAWTFQDPDLQRKWFDDK
ncbi:UNVERIFIED_CONTAM: hypothetical protein GTU68_026567, partial [Idotea baltica]|nr:hypothetical protein [Idotea baltica]